MVILDPLNLSTVHANVVLFPMLLLSLVLDMELRKKKKKSKGMNML